MKYRTQQLLELLKKSHTAKFKIQYWVYKKLNLQEHLTELEKDNTLETTVIRVAGNIIINVELKKKKTNYKKT